MTDDRLVFRSRERMRPWPVHIAIASFAFPVGLGVAVALDRGGATVAWVVAGVVAAAIAADAVRCRHVTFGPDALTIGDLSFSWRDIENTHVREMPIARAGWFVRVTDAARASHGLPPPRHRDYGPGLKPAPTPELAAERFDFFLRAHRARLEAWFHWASLYQLGAARASLVDAVEKAGLTASSARVTASVVVAELDTFTIELRADSVDAVLHGADAALRDVLPDAVRWDPAFAGGVMVLVGPLELGRDPRAEACLDHVKAAVKAQIRGTPRAIAAMFAARS